MKSFRNLKIGTRLGLGFGLVLVFVLILSYISVVKMKALSGLTVKLYRHPYTVTTAILEIEANIIKIHRSMKDVALARNDAEMDRAVETVARYEAEVYERFEVIYDRFLGTSRRWTRPRSCSRIGSRFARRWCG